MLPAALTLAALGLTVNQLSKNTETTLQTDSYEDIDNLMIGRIREENYANGNNWTSETSRIVRPTIGRKDPAVSAKEWTNYHRDHNKALQDLHVKNQIADNQRVLRTSVESKQRILFLPDSSFTVGQRVPNSYTDYTTPPQPGSKFRLDTDYTKYDDQASTASGAVIEYIWNPANYFGTPWGPGGQLYEHLRTKSRDTPDTDKRDKHVRFGGTTIF